MTSEQKEMKEQSCVDCRLCGPFCCRVAFNISYHIHAHLATYFPFAMKINSTGIKAAVTAFNKGESGAL
jgi:Fe-S-cluster-containing hydrogenase component 2